jgi:hypothetical protein
MHSYAEAADILYSHNVFEFNLHLLTQFAKLRIIPPQRLNAMRSIHCRWTFYTRHVPSNWKPVWNIIAEMKGLQEIVLDVSAWFPQVNLERERKMFEPMRAIKGMKVFEVHLPWQGEEDLDAPFRIIRRKRKEVVDAVHS